MTIEEKNEIVQDVINYISEHLNIEVSGEHDPYSGQSEHYHSVTFYFN